MFVFFTLTAGKMWVGPTWSKLYGYEQSRKVESRKVEVTLGQVQDVCGWLCQETTAIIPAKVMKLSSQKRTVEMGRNDFHPLKPSVFACILPGGRNDHLLNSNCTLGNALGILCLLSS